MRDPRALAGGVDGDPANAFGLAGSALLHLAIAATLILGRPREHPRAMPIAYKVTLVAAPAPAAAASSVPATTTPAHAPPAVKPPPRAATRPAPRTPPARRPAPAPAHAPAPPSRTRPSAAPAQPKATPAPPQPGPTAAPAAAPGVGSDVATVRTEGVEFPFPGYLHNLVSQVYRRWRPPPSNAQLQAEVFFLVHRDGSVTGIQFIQRSGSFAFDLEAQGAIEAAARADAFGDLPGGYGADVLPVSFFFSPRNVR